MGTTLTRSLLATCFSVAAATLCHAAAPAPGGEHADLVTATMLADVDAVAPGSSFTLGVRLKMKPHWHTYWLNPGEAGDATKAKLKGPAGFEFGAIQWPLPIKIDAPGGITYGYEDEVLLLIPVTVSKDVPVRGDATIDADVSWLVCKDECIMGEAKLKLALPLSAAPKPANRELFNTWEKRLPVAADDKLAAKMLSKVEQAGGEGKAAAPALTVRWNEAPKKVEWFPVATRAVSVDNVTVRHEGTETKIEFKPTIYQPDEVPAGGRLDSVLVYEDAEGMRHGIVVPFTVAAESK